MASTGNITFSVQATCPPNGHLFDKFDDLYLFCRSCGQFRKRPPVQMTTAPEPIYYQIYPNYPTYPNYQISPTIPYQWWTNTAGATAITY